MEGGMVFEGSSFPVLLQNDRLPSSDVLDNLWISNPSSSFHDSTSMVKFEASQGELNNMITPFFSPLDMEENGDEDYDRSAFYQPPEKKRRLSVDQVQFLEKSFEVDNKLEPDRKVELAKELNLQPRQIAIWFQNRRARYKNKQLEKDYDILKASYDKLKVDFGSLQNENEKLKQEVHFLMEKLVDREQGREIGSKQFEMINSIDMEPSKPISIANSTNVTNVEPNVIYKVEDANSANSEGDSCHFFERENSDFSPDEDENLSRSLLRPPRFPKLEEGSYIDVSENSCDLGYAVEDEPLWFWAN